jgi:intraflagellar transport protein 172
VPELQAEMAAALRSESNGSDSADSILARARALEKSRDYARAIDAYLSLTKEYTPDLNLLEQAWETAVKLAMNYVTERTNDVIGHVSKRLIDIGRCEQVG